MKRLRRGGSSAVLRHPWGSFGWEDPTAAASWDCQLWSACLTCSLVPWPPAVGLLLLMVGVLSAHRHDRDAATLLPHCCHTAATLLPHCCHTAVTLLPHCCHTAVTLLPHCCHTAATLLPHCCHTAVTLLSHCCHTAATLLSHCCFCTCSTTAVVSRCECGLYLVKNGNGQQHCLCNWLLLPWSITSCTLGSSNPYQSLI
jgi:hypothetical protein